MISFRSSTTLPLFGLLIALAGCSGQTGAASAVDSTAAAQTTKNTADNVHPSPAAFHRPPHGPEHLLAAALHEPINLSAEQKTAIEGALAEAAPKGLPAFDRTRVVALAAAVRAGKVDPASLPAAPGALDDAVNARRAASAKALDMLHATLTKEQRRALVDAVSKRATEHGCGSWRSPKRPQGSSSSFQPTSMP